MDLATTNDLAEQNDRFRCWAVSWFSIQKSNQGHICRTAGLAALDLTKQLEVLGAVRNFNGLDGSFAGDEHDLGAIEIKGLGRVYWQIDYYADASLEKRSEAPSDPSKCYRVLTIMLAKEYD